MAEPQPDFIFVYGLLKRGEALHHLMAGATYRGEAVLSGRLVSLGRYPGLVAGDDDVAGELYDASDLPALLDTLDDVEEFDPADPEHSAYLREVCRPRRADGTEVAAWVYRYNGPLADARPIPSGHWPQREES